MPPQYPLLVGLRLRLTQPTKLLITDGLRDAYVRVGGSVWGTQLLAVYHDYSGDTNATNVTRNAAAALSKDIKKLWLQAELKF